MLIAPDSPWGKEQWRWEHHQGEGHPSDPHLRGMRPSQFQPYPAMLYRATNNNPWTFEQKVVADEVAERLACGQGFVAGGQGKAAEAYQARELEIATAAAERNYSDRNVSAKARAESDAAEESSSRHLGEIPRTPVKRGRGRPRTVPAPG